MYSEKNGLQKLRSWFFEILKNLEIWRFKKKISLQIPQISKYSKTGTYVLERSLKNVCSKFQVIPYRNVIFIAFWMWKWLLFRAIGRNIMQFHIFILFRFICNKRCSNVVFRVLDDKPTHAHVLRRQMTEIGNLTSWPRVTLTSEKVASG